MFQSLTKRFEPIKVVYHGKSKVVPDMSYTPREIIAKFSRGERVPLGFRSVYDSQDDPEQDKFTDDASVFQDDPTRDPNFDRFDYAEEKHELSEREKERKRIAKAKAAASSKRKASDEELSGSDATKRETTSEEAAAAPPTQPKE